MIHFGTGGWRAIIGDEFTKSNVQILANGVVDMIKEDGMADMGYCIGFDRRFLSESAAHWAAEVFAGAGISCKVIRKEAPTPLIMFAVKHMGMAGGLAITASHNPAEYNGIKVFVEHGRDANEEETKRIEAFLAYQREDRVPVMPYQKGIEAGLIEEIDPLNDYVDRIISAVDIGRIREKGSKIVLDPMYGVSETALRTILMTARCEVDVIHERHDALFGGRLPAPNNETLRSLKNYVIEKKCDVGIATDGDADRLGVIDDTGKFLHPNDILALLYYYLVCYKGWSGAVVRNLSTTHLLDAIADKFGYECHEVPVGFKYISEKMAETNAVIGGESSGGLTVRGHIQGKDGIYAATLLIEMMAITEKKLSALLAEIRQEFGEYHMAEGNYRFEPERRDGLVKVLFEEKKLPEFSCQVDHVSYLDGCKVYFSHGGWISVRFSGTEPLLRIFCETSSMQVSQKLIDELADYLEL